MRASICEVVIEGFTGQSEYEGIVYDQGVLVHFSNGARAELFDLIPLMTTKEFKSNEALIGKTIFAEITAFICRPEIVKKQTKLIEGANNRHNLIGEFVGYRPDGSQIIDVGVGTVTLSWSERVKDAKIGDYFKIQGCRLDLNSYVQITENAKAIEWARSTVQNIVNHVKIWAKIVRTNMHSELFDNSGEGNYFDYLNIRKELVSLLNQEVKLSDEKDKQELLSALVTLQETDEKFRNNFLHMQKNAFLLKGLKVDADCNERCWFLYGLPKDAPEEWKRRLSEPEKSILTRFKELLGFGKKS